MDEPYPVMVVFDHGGNVIARIEADVRDDGSVWYHSPGGLPDAAGHRLDYSRCPNRHKEWERIKKDLRRKGWDV
ncbi:MAG: hypothetical protein EBR82_18070 [Caulobacteraceae bacterium]|nr:hypothetical protein [Caulobacteraceae bacterium]